VREPASSSRPPAWAKFARALPDPLVLLDADGVVLYANAAAERVFGYSSEEIAGTSAMHLVHPDDLWEAADALRRRVDQSANLPVPRALRVRHGDGSWIATELIGTNHLDDPEIGGIVVTLRDVSDRVGLVHALEESERRFHAVVRHASEAVLLLDAQGVVRYASAAIVPTTGWRPEELLGSNGLDIVHPDDLPELLESVTPLFSQPGAHAVVEYRLRNRMGAWRHCECLFVNMLDDPAVGRVGVYVRDITGRKEMADALRASEERFRSAFENAPIGMALQHLDGRFVMVNRALCELLGTSHDELLATDDDALTHPGDHNEHVALRRRMQRGELSSYQLEQRYLRPDGDVVWAKVSVSCTVDGDGRPRYAIAQIEDITGRRRDEERLTYQALHDMLTGLPNRALLLDRLAVALDRQQDQQPTAVLFCDLDRFKVVNDSDGHQIGDRVLVECAERLRRVVRHGDTVARFGGDEFVVLCAGLTQRDEAVAVARRVLEALDEPFVVDDREFFVSTSIGIAYADADTGPDDLLRDADAAMYRAKDRGRGSFVVFEPEMRRSARARAELERALRRALDNGELRLHYQPLVTVDAGAVVGAEALVRWAHPQRGMVSPGEFVPLAEDTGLILPLGRWVVAEACERVARWEQTGMLPPGFRLTVNLSLRQLAEPGFAGDVAATLREHGVDPQRMCFEVTESALADDGGVAVRALRALRALGVGLAIDDFGTGYSALSHLKRFPFDTIKIDRSFIDGLGRDAEDEAIVGAIVGIARALGLDVIAEGIETSEQADALVARGVRVGQGFLFSPAVPEHLFVQLLGVLVG
jgi:diguanylate cyclase (GGDEF)-like protein/PAS domain S-box-containing protein